jgi:S1-C subfamily serine protease
MSALFFSYHTLPFPSIILFFSVRSGDLITKIDGKRVKGVRDVLDAIGFDVGRTVQFVIKRQGGDEATLQIKLAPELERRRY